MSIEGSALSPRIQELRGRLAAAVGDAPSSDRTPREALDLYRAIGATGHAERLARELDFPTLLRPYRLWSGDPVAIRSLIRWMSSGYDEARITRSNWAR